MRASSFVVFIFLISGFCFAQETEKFVEKTVWLDFHYRPFAKSIWKGLELSTGKVVEKPVIDKQVWDLRFRQGYIGTNNVRVIVLKKSLFDNVTAAYQPPSGPDSNTDLQYLIDKKYLPSGPSGLEEDYYNPNLMKWYDYVMRGLMDHRLRPHPNVFVMETADHHYAKLEIKDYVFDQKGYFWPSDYKEDQKEISEDDEREWKDAIAKDPRSDKKFLPNQVHIKIHYKYNTVAHDTSLK